MLTEQDRLHIEEIKADREQWATVLRQCLIQLEVIDQRLIAAQARCSHSNTTGLYCNDCEKKVFNKK